MESRRHELLEDGMVSGSLVQYFECNVRVFLSPMDMLLVSPPPTRRQRSDILCLIYLFRIRSAAVVVVCGWWWWWWTTLKFHCGRCQSSSSTQQAWNGKIELRRGGDLFYGKTVYINLLVAANVIPNK